MSIDASVVSYVIRHNDITGVQRLGIDSDFFVDEWRTIWRYILRVKRDHDDIPSKATLRARFPDIELPQVRKSELPHLAAQIRQRKKYITFLENLNEAAGNANDFEAVDEVIQTLQGKLNDLAFKSGQTNHMVDLFSVEVGKQIRREIQKRRSGQVAGIPTGLHKFDTIAGGLHKQRSVTVIGRTGIGKSWIDLLFVASTVQWGGKVVLYPLEMTLFETAARLYSIFSQRMFGMEGVLKNYDITTGRVSKRQVIRFLHAMEDRFAGQLYVADVGNLADPYTVERIEAEVEVYQPDMFWVDYITLLKPPPGSKDEGDHVAVSKLSKGIKNTAMRRNCIGGASAQVNREAIRNRVFLPRLEHIAFGDAIGHDADQVFSINRTGDYLHYALVKNRGGPEIGTHRKRGVRVNFFPNEGVIEEASDDDQEQDDDD